jgi:HUS1 checkpoint protein
MKFRATFSSVGVQWLERFVPVFEKLGKEVTVLLTSNTVHLVQDAVVSGGLELHADLLKEEVFDEYNISSNNDDKIAFALEPATLHRVLRGLIGSEATRVEVKLIKRLVAPQKSLPFLNFTSEGVVDVTQDVPVAGPLTKREISALEKLVRANVVDVPYWLNLDRGGTEILHATIERFRAIGSVVELATTRHGALHVVVSSAHAGAAVLGTELRNVTVLPADGSAPGDAQRNASDENANAFDDSDDTTRDLTDSDAAERLAHAKTSGAASAVRVDTRQLWKSLAGTSSNPSDCLFGIAKYKGHIELVYRYDRQAVHGNDAVGLMVRVPVEEEEDVEFDE